MTAAATAAGSTRPAADEFAPYYGKYIDKVPEGDIVAQLGRQLQETLQLIEKVPEERGGYRYAEGKWSLREVLGHIIDAERVFAYRAMRIARGDATPLPGFDQDVYVPASNADHRTLRDLADELGHLRRANMALFRSLPAEAWGRRGTASNNPVTPRALAYIMAGHELHHMQIVREKYLG